jgi:hypothetical protein
MWFNFQILSSWSLSMFETFFFYFWIYNNNLLTSILSFHFSEHLKNNYMFSTENACCNLTADIFTYINISWSSFRINSDVLKLFIPCISNQYIYLIQPTKWTIRCTYYWYKHLFDMFRHECHHQGVHMTSMKPATVDKSRLINFFNSYTVYYRICREWPTTFTELYTYFYFMWWLLHVSAIIMPSSRSS